MTVEAPIFNQERAREGIVQYSVVLDSQRTIAFLESDPTRDEIKRHEEYILRQLRTDVAERLDLAEARYNYEIRDGKLYAPMGGEPFEDTITRGIWDRRLYGEEPEDLPRENAELVAFRRTQELLANPQTPVGTTILEISPRGRGAKTSYIKNVFEFKTKVDERTVQTTRYLSNLSNHEYWEKIIELNPAYKAVLGPDATDVDLKSVPVLISPNIEGLDHDSLALKILKEKIGMDNEEFEGLLDAGRVLASLYLYTLTHEPENITKLKGIYEDYLKTVMLARYALIGRFFTPDEVVPIPGGACGPGGCSVSEFGKPTDKYGVREFSCPDCKETNLRPQDTLLSACQKCGSKKVLPPGLS